MSWNLNVSELPDTENIYSPIPAGEYTVVTEKAELKQTKAGTGEYISIQFRVIENQYSNRIVFGMLNIRNASADAERIGRQQLKQLLIAIGVQSISSENLNDLISKTLKIKVKIRAASGNYDATNTIVGFSSVQNILNKPAGGNTLQSQKPAFMRR